MSIFKCPTCNREMDDFDEISYHFTHCYLPKHLLKQREEKE